MGVCTFARASGSQADDAESVYEGFRVVRGNLSFSGSYATGGDTIPLANVGLQEIRKIFIDPTMGVFGNASGLSANLGGTPQVPTLVALVAATGGAGAAAEVANLTNLTGKNIPCWLLGSG